MSYGVNDLRRMFLEFFERQGHLVMKSFSLVPHNDNSLLLINAGMAPLKPYFTGQEVPPRSRVATCQKCVRTGDIDNVGKTARHLTFFEMLGNFSFGDYFKKEALVWTWEFLTKDCGLDPDRLYPSIFMDDDEAFDIWTKVIGISEDRITKFGRDKDGKSDNFWEHGAGPCGPCSEVYYDRGEKFESGEFEEIENATGFLVGKDSGRYMEVWNDVFTQFEGDGKGNYSQLKNKNIDTGMGLERLAVVVQDVESVFDIDTMRAIRNKICSLANVKYEEDKQKDISIRIIVDHMRSSTFMISDGIMPSNEGRGYVLRRLIRRAVRHGRKLGINGDFLSDVAKVVIEGSKDGYTELEEKSEFIIRVLSEEETKFASTLDQGLKILSEMIEELNKSGSKILSGEDTFKLYDTFGFPIDLTTDILSEHNLSADEEGFAKEMTEQRQKARSSRKSTNYMGAEHTAYDDIDKSLTSVFIGYDRLQNVSRISAMTEDIVDEEDGGRTASTVVEALTDGQLGTVIADETVFYGTMGGQVGDKGVIVGKDAEFEVTDTVHLKGGKIGHIGKMTRGMIKVGDSVEFKVDASGRREICKNHSATHLLHKALRTVLGTHVEQAGSLVASDRLRFDFSHFSAMTREEIAEVERLVNEAIAASYPVITDIMSLEDAKKTGAMALFGEKYGDKVRVVNMGDYSIELCGGTHVSNTSAINSFKILSENGIAAGVRRIEAISGEGVRKYYAGLEEKLKAASDLLKTNPDKLVEHIKHLQLELKNIKSELESVKSKQAMEAAGNAVSEAVDVKGVKLVAKKIEGADMNSLRDLGDSLKTKLAPAVIVLLSESEGKVNLIVMATDDAVKLGAHAGNLVKEIAPLVGGGGGGRPNMAQAGGKNPSGIKAALEKAKEALEKQL